jgi:hypothetical protein
MRIPTDSSRHGYAPAVLLTSLAVAVCILAPSHPASTAAASRETPAKAARATGTWWKPGAATLRWQWELDHPLNLASAADMATSSRLPSGAAAPAPTVYDIDAIINPRSTITALHAMGDRVICYLTVGTAGNYYTAADEHVARTYYAQLAAAHVLGRKVPGYPERFLDIRSAKTVSVIERMIADQCAAKGFDAVETDLDETYAGADGTTGFPLTQADEIRFMTTLANFMHARGLAWIAKNPDDTGDSYATRIAPLADGVLTESCNQFDTCSALKAFLGHKAVFNAEYMLAPTAFCARDIQRQMNGVRFSVQLDGSVRQPCQ